MDEMSIVATSGRSIELLSAVPQVGETVFTDRAHSFLSLGDFANMQAAHYVKPPNNDKDTDNTETMWMLSVPRPVEIYLDFYAPDTDQLEGAKTWLDSDGWLEQPQMTGSSFSIEGSNPRGPGKVYMKTFSQSGEIALKGKGSSNSGVYLVFVVDL